MERLKMATCPECGSKNVERYTHRGLNCNDCGYDGRSDEFQKQQAPPDLAAVLAEALKKSK